MECLSGIPGSVGATPVQNVGAYGQEVSQTIESVRVFDTTSGSFRNMPRQDLKFGYRSSVFNGPERGRFVITALHFKLWKDRAPDLVYSGLRERFEGRRPTLAEVRDEVREMRKAKGMLAGQGGPEANSVGSFFKNPVVPPAKVSELAESLGRGDMPVFDATGGMKKLSAAWLIEQAGFRKGQVLGGAAISPLHSLALINPGAATAADIVSLKAAVETAVAEKFGIALETEPVLVGF